MALTMADNPSCHAPVYSNNNPPSSDLSRLYTFLPSAVKTRIPILTSIRRSVGMVATRRPKSKRSQSFSAADLHGFTDPANTYCNPNNEVVTREQLWQLTKRKSQSRPATPETMPSTVTTEDSGNNQMPADFGMPPLSSESRSGVDWNIATPGIMLLSNARYQIVRQPDTDPAILRSLHIDGLTYLLRALPKDLTPRELDAIDEVLPTPLRGQVIDGRRVTQYTTTSQSQQEQNVLRRSITYTIIQLALLFSFILPLLTNMLNRCVRYERQHQITERVLTNGIGTVETVGERGLDLKDALVKFGHGRVGGAVWDAGIWVVEGVVGGVSDGVGRAMVVVGQAVIATPQTTIALQGRTDMGSRQLK